MLVIKDVSERLENAPRVSRTRGKARRAIQGNMIDAPSDIDENSEDYDDDGDPPPIRTHVVIDSENPRYKFELEEHKTYDFPSAHVKISGVVLHNPSANSNNKRKKGEAAWIKVGKLEGNLLRRDLLRQNAVFYQVCDAESEELQKVGCIFCNADGTLRHKNLDGLSRARDRNSSYGNFLHIDTVALDSSHRSKGVGLRFLNALLEWEEWTIAAINPSSLTESWFVRNGLHEEPWQPRTKEEQEAIEDKVCRAFARLGFKQAAFGSEAWYLVPRCHANPMLPKEAVSHMKRTILNKSGKDKDEEGPTEDLRAVMLGKRIRMDIHDQRISGPRRAPLATTNVIEMIDAIKQCIEKGADIDDSCVIHAVVCKAGVKQFELELAVSLLSYLVIELDANINAVDDYGRSPLHCVGHRFNLNIALLLKEFGADRDLKNKNGATAFDEWCERQTGNNDYMHCFDVRSSNSAEMHRIDFQHALVIAPDAIKSNLVDGFMSPRMHLLLSMAAADLCLKLDADVPWEFRLLDVLPETALNRLRDFEYCGRDVMDGYKHVLLKILDLLRRKVFPKPELVRQMLTHDPQDDGSSPEEQQLRQKAINEYFAVGGFVENALDAVLIRAKMILTGENDEDYDEDYDEDDEYLRYEDEDGNIRCSIYEPKALDAEKCPGGRGVDFIADLPLELSRRVLTQLDPRQLARCQCVSVAWRNVCRDPIHTSDMPEMCELDENFPLVRKMLIGPSKNGYGEPFEPANE